jgi:ribonuclease R
MPKRYEQRIMRTLSRRDYQPLKQRALARALNIEDEDYQIFTQAIKNLLEEEKIARGAKDVITLPSMEEGKIAGVFESTSKGYGFLRPENPLMQGDLFIPAGAALDAVNGDAVVAKVTGRTKRGGQERYTGRIVEIVTRRRTHYVGTVECVKGQWFVRPDGKELSNLIMVDDPAAKNAKPGDKVRVEILHYPTERYLAQGVITERLGKSGAPSVELKAVMSRFELPDKFPKTVLENARDSIQRFERTAEKSDDSREDIRDETIITIDPVDAKDFDDAVSIKKLPRGVWELGVHIADVSFFIPENSPLDREAKQRGNSVYLPGHVVPMLPELLSNGVCSLQPARDRFVKSAYIRLGQRGEVLETRFANSVIRSSRRLTYEDAEDILAGKTIGFSDEVVSLVRDMEKLAKIIQQRRRQAGMLNLEIPRAELIFDAQGRVIDARPESTSFPHTIIEMFMVEANEASARLLDGLRVPFLRRIHPEPDALARSESARVIKLCGYVIPKNIDRHGLQKLLDSVRGTPQSFVINLAVLKSLQRAEYSPAPMGHYALASEHYCHFTSPIRRYPDLEVHRLIQAKLEGRLTRKTANQFPDEAQLEELGRQCSQTERNAAQAEDDLRSFMILQMLQERVGEQINAVVTSVTNFGVFVQCERILIDGLIRAEDVIRHEASKSKGRQAARGRNHSGSFSERCPYRIGQELRVQIAAVNPAARTLDLVPV